MHPRRRLHQTLQDPVYPVANARALSLRLNMNIAGAVLNCGEQRHVHEIHDRAAFDHLIEIGGSAFVDRFAFNHLDVRVLQRSEERIDIDVASSILLYELDDVGFKRQDRTDLAAGETSQRINRR